MSDLIDRQAAIDALARFVPYAICDVQTESYTNGLTDAYNLICQLPSAQPEIIRCKDCRFYPNHGYKKDVVFDADACHWNADEMPDPDDYCSAAERREEHE